MFKALVFSTIVLSSVAFAGEDYLLHSCEAKNFRDDPAEALMDGFRGAKSFTLERDASKTVLNNVYLGGIWQDENDPDIRRIEYKNYESCKEVPTGSGNAALIDFFPRTEVTIDKTVVTKNRVTKSRHIDSGLGYWEKYLTQIDFNNDSTITITFTDRTRAGFLASIDKTDIKCYYYKK